MGVSDVFPEIYGDILSTCNNLGKLIMDIGNLFRIAKSYKLNIVTFTSNKAKILDACDSLFTIKDTVNRESNPVCMQLLKPRLPSSVDATTINYLYKIPLTINDETK